MDPAAAAAGIKEVLIDRSVPLIYEVRELIQASGGPSLAPILDSISKRTWSLPAWIGRREREAAEQRAVTAAISWYRAEVEAPAAAIVRERKAASPSPVRKVVIVTALDAGDADAYRAALDGIEPDLSRIAAATPGVFALRVSPPAPAATTSSDPPRTHIALHGGGAVIASADHGILALYYGHCRPCQPSTGFYLVYDAWSNSLAAVPQLPPTSISIFSHHSIGSAGVAVLRLRPRHDYVLAELLLRYRDDGGGRNRPATLCLWCSSGPDAGRWIQREVILPLPSSSASGSEFCADTVLAVQGTSLCWVDLLIGVLVCDDIPLLAGRADDDDDPAAAAEVSFRFIPLPDGCVIGAVDPLSRHGRGRPEERRSMSAACPCSADGPAIKFVSMEGHAAGCTINTWTLHLWDPDLEWKRGAASLCVGKLWDDPSYRDLKLPAIMPSRPLLSMLQDDAVYLYMTANLVISVDMRRGKVISALRPHPQRDGRSYQLPYILIRY